MLRQYFRISNLVSHQNKQFSHLSKFATLDPQQLSGSNPHTVQNYVNGQWKQTKNLKAIIDPLNGEKFIYVPTTDTADEQNEIINCMNQCPKSGLHNPLKNPQRYNEYGEVFHKASMVLSEPEVLDFFTKLIQRVMPKNDAQARAEVSIMRKAMMNFSGDSPRFICSSKNVAGDHPGQQSTSYRWPYGPVSIISPFNFPLEIPALQQIGALVTGNKLLIKGDCRVTVVMEQWNRFLLYCGLPKQDMVYMSSDGAVMENILLKSNMRMTQFTGSSVIAERLAEKLRGKIKIEDAGFDWKILGPDVSNFEYVAWQSDQDAYAMSGQKCSAQSILFCHENWQNAGFIQKIQELAQKRSLASNTLSPVITWNNKQIEEHMNKVLTVPGSKLLFGGKPLNEPHKIPECYGSWQPTAVYVPFEQIQKYKHIVCKELFGPFQIVTTYKSENLNQLLDILESMEHHLTAAVVSNDNLFANYILENTVNGVTYQGNRARTTGAPQNHWFGPCGDPRGAGIGTPEAVLLCWTSQREVIKDVGPVSDKWTVPKPT